MKAALASSLVAMMVAAASAQTMPGGRPGTCTAESTACQADTACSAIVAAKWRDVDPISDMEYYVALYDDALGLAWMDCNEPPQPCSNDAARPNARRVTFNCLATEACASVLAPDFFENNQTAVYSSGCGANADCCAAVTCSTDFNCVEPTTSTPPAPSTSSAIRASAGIALVLGALF